MVKRDPPEGKETDNLQWPFHVPACNICRGAEVSNLADNNSSLTVGSKFSSATEGLKCFVILLFNPFLAATAHPSFFIVKNGIYFSA